MNSNRRPNLGAATGIGIVVALVFLMLAIVTGAYGQTPSFTPAASDHQPPRFLPALALYRANRFVGLQVGKSFSLSCHDALEDTKGTMQRALNLPPDLRVVGLCIPIPTYDVADLVPESDGPAKPADNSL